MTSSGWHLAELNVGRLHEPLDHPATAEFVDALPAINELAEASPGFVWRLKDEETGLSSSYVRADDDPLLIINLSVWETPEQLHDFVYRTAHTPYLRRRREWFRADGRRSWCAGGSRPVTGRRSRRRWPASTGSVATARATTRSRCATSARCRRGTLGRRDRSPAQPRPPAAAVRASAAVAPGSTSGMHHVAPASARASGSGGRRRPARRRARRAPSRQRRARPRRPLASTSSRIEQREALEVVAGNAPRAGAEAGPSGDPDRHARPLHAGRRRQPTAGGRHRLAGQHRQQQLDAGVERGGPCPVVGRPARRTPSTRRSCRRRGRGRAPSDRPTAGRASWSPGRRAAGGGAGRASTIVPMAHPLGRGGDRRQRHPRIGERHAASGSTGGPTRTRRPSRRPRPSPPPRRARAGSASSPASAIDNPQRTSVRRP